MKQIINIFFFYYYGSVHPAFEINPRILKFPDTSVVHNVVFNVIELLKLRIIYILSYQCYQNLKTIVTHLEINFFITYSIKFIKTS